MPWKKWFALGLLGSACGCQDLPVGSGLEIARYSARNLVTAPVDASRDCQDRRQYRQQACKAWLAIADAQPETHYSSHYAEGFQDGFTDYLYAGGNGEPPVVPPWCDRRNGWETPAGRAHIEDWYAGYRHGAQAARASGLRETIVLPCSLPGQAPVIPPVRPGVVGAPVQTPTPTTAQNAQASQATSPVEDLPNPRPAPAPREANQP